MDATILLLGAPLFTLQGAGAGYASIEVSSSGEISSPGEISSSGEMYTDRGATAVALQFAAGSFPARAHGLNGFGILREALVRRAGATELSFAGLMTCTREQSLEEGRKALKRSQAGAEAVVARGRVSRTGIETWIDTIDLAADRDWTNLNEMLCDVLQREPRTAPRETDSQASATFLHTIRLAALSKTAVYRREFTHAGVGHWLETRRHAERPFELTGTIHDLEGNRCADFHNTYAPGDQSGIPIRIEYRPRSFLRLTFEAEHEANGPVPSVFHQESA
jgi:hypothetical protein